MKLLIGSHNTAKIEEYKKFLVHSNLRLITLKELGLFDEPLEIGNTYQEIALQKARYYAGKTEYPTLADDAGFEIDALDGRPGIESNRWVGPHGTDEDRINKVIDLLKGVSQDKRTARLRFVTAVYFPVERDYVTVERKIEGFVPELPSEHRMIGFPYRPIFFLPQFNKNMIDLTQDEYDTINYRKDACRELLLKLEPYIN